MGVITRGTTNPNRLRRVDRWIAATQGRSLRARDRPLVVDLGYGASPVTTVELFLRLRAVCPRVEVVGLEIDPERVAVAQEFLRRTPYRGLSFRRGGFELPVDRPPALVRAFNVLRQYDEATAWESWHRICSGLAPGGVLVEGTCDEIGRRAVWVALTNGPGLARHVPRPAEPALARTAAGRAGSRAAPEPVPQTITFAARVASLPQPSELAERLPKTLIHRNVPGEPIHGLLGDFDRAWASAAPQSAFGPRQRWITAVRLLARSWPVETRAPLGGRARWRLGEVTLPWSAVAPPAGEDHYPA
jgi:SAM-dependent methyltransferase